MQKCTKTCLSLLLTLAILCTGAALVPAGAKASAQNPNGCTPQTSCDYSPTIIVPGINQSVTYLYDDDGEKTSLGGGIIFPDTANLPLPQLIFRLLLSFVAQRDLGLTKIVYQTVAQMFEPQRVDNEGRYVHDLRTDIIGRVSDMTPEQRNLCLNIYVPAQGIIDLAGEDHLFFFAFNLVNDIWNNADALADYIDSVRKTTGHKKVNLVNVSLGGTVFTAYLEKYGHKKLDQVINVVSATDGSTMFADLMTHKVNRDEDFLHRNWLPDMMEHDLKIAPGYNKTIGYAASLVLRLVPNALLENIISAAWQAILDTVILNCSQLWALVPAARYDEVAAMHLQGEAHAVLREKTDRYHQAQLHLRQNILDATKDGVYINNIAGSNLTFGEGEYTYFQVCESRTKVNSDGIIDTRGATMGATAAAPGQTLPAGYKPLAPGYLSPDGAIDCSTAVLPNNTWVFLGQPHEVGRNDAVLALAVELLRTPGMTVHTNPAQYPQYNHVMNTNELRRWRIAEAQALLKEGTLSPAEAEELQAAIDEGLAVRALTVGDAARAWQATQALNAQLALYGKYTPPAPYAWYQTGLEALTATLSQLAQYFYGVNGYSEGGSFVRLFKALTA